MQIFWYSWHSLISLHVLPSVDRRYLSNLSHVDVLYEKVEKLLELTQVCNDNGNVQINFCIFVGIFLRKYNKNSSRDNFVVRASTWNGCTFIQVHALVIRVSSKPSFAGASEWSWRVLANTVQATDRIRIGTLIFESVIIISQRKNKAILHI